MSDNIVSLAEHRGETSSEIDLENQALINLGIPKEDVWAYITSSVVAAVNGASNFDTTKRFHNLKVLFEAFNLPVRIGEFSKARKEIAAGSQLAVDKFLALQEAPSAKFCALIKIITSNPEIYNSFLRTDTGKFVFYEALRPKTAAVANDQPGLTLERAAEVLEEYAQRFPDHPPLLKSLEIAIQAKETIRAEPPLSPYELRKKNMVFWKDACDQFFDRTRSKLLELEYSSEVVDELLNFFADIKSAMPRNITYENMLSAFAETVSQRAVDIDLRSFILKHSGLRADDIPDILNSMEQKA